MSRPVSSRPPTTDPRLVPAIIILLAVIVFVFSVIGIHESRKDSFALLVRQGQAFTNGLAEGAANAIAAKGFYDRFQYRRYVELIDQLLKQETARTSELALTAFATAHDLEAVYIFDTDSQFIASGSARDGLTEPSVELRAAVTKLLSSPDIPFSMTTFEDERTGETIQYYLEIVGSIGQVVVLAAGAQTYDEALRRTGIGFLAQRMARSPDVEYIIYQTEEGIVFSSTDPGRLPAIESDSFLQAALAHDTVSSRLLDFRGDRVLELAKSFATPQYEIGVLRVGVSLDGYFALSRAYTWQIIILSVGLLGLVSLVVLNARSRRHRQQLTQEVSRIKSLTDTIFEQMRVGIAAIDDVGVVRLLNREAETILDVSHAEGRAWKDIAAAPELSLDQFLSSGQQSSEAEVNWRAGGRSRELLVARSRVRYDDRSGGAVVVVMYDITSLKKYERDAVRRERLSEMGNLAAGVAHEIRNPLNTISIAAQRLAAEFTPTQGSAEYLEFTQKIRSETKRLNDIITRFLTLARDSRPSPDATDLGDTVRDALTLIQVEADELGIQILPRIAGNLVVGLEANMLRELLLNLFNNAKEALKGRPGIITITGAQVGEAVEIRFADNGPGIPESHRAQVFTPYFTTKEAGTGIGLAAVHRIVTDADGTIRIEETPGGGATFVIRLPVSGTQGS